MSPETAMIGRTLDSVIGEIFLGNEAELEAAAPIGATVAQADA